MELKIFLIHLILTLRWGSSNWKHHFAGNNARVIDNCLNKGAILVGKTVTSEYAVHALNKTKKFLCNHLLTPGTSSSGSAVAVASKTILFFRISKCRIYY